MGTLIVVDEEYLDGLLKDGGACWVANRPILNWLSALKLAVSRRPDIPAERVEFVFRQAFALWNMRRSRAAKERRKIRERDARIRKMARRQRPLFGT
ncbi:MAG: hypothetical protein Q7R62_03600 [bacterium]|nr:hypothetical protein [bacterium]